MPLSIVVGGQYGSEGKGKVAHIWAERTHARAVVRVGGPNSGHTVYDPSGRKFIFQHLPTAAILRDTLCVIGAGSYIDVDQLFREIDAIDLSSKRLLIDPNAVVIGSTDRDTEASAGLREAVGSTLTGTGAAVMSRVRRNSDQMLAKHHARLASCIVDTKETIRKMLDAGDRVLIEGTQGYGLSVLHSPHYPFATSRDTTAAGMLSEVGMSPLDVDDVVLVVRAFPIRVPGNSGPLDSETTWRDVEAQSNSSDRLQELTSVTKGVRRVAKFSPEIVRAALTANRPSTVVLNHADYWDRQSYGASTPSKAIVKQMELVEESVNRRMDFVGLDERSIAVANSGR